MNPGWARDPFRGASGRRRYHARRREQARERQAQIAHYLSSTGTSLLPRGSQRKLAVMFEVAESTMSKDLKAIYAQPAKNRPHCPFCGASAIDAEGAEAVTNGHPFSPLRSVV